MARLASVIAGEEDMAILPEFKSDEAKRIWDEKVSATQAGHTFLFEELDWLVLQGVTSRYATLAPSWMVVAEAA